MSPHDWRSVVVSGTLTELAAEEVDESLEPWFHTVAGDIDVEESPLDFH